MLPLDASSCVQASKTCYNDLMGTCLKGAFECMLDDPREHCNRYFRTLHLSLFLL